MARSIININVSTVLLAFLISSSSLASATRNSNIPEPAVVLGNAKVVGKANGTTIQYLGVPYAQPPVGDLRLRLPQAVSPYNGTVNATSFGNQCIQQTVTTLSLPDNVPAAVGQDLGAFFAPLDVPQCEDCLNLNVVVPVDTTPESKLPVAVWMYGGAFQIGSNSIEPGAAVVARSIEIGHPIIHVAINYRLSAFGFLGGRVVKEAGIGNLGLQDQREGFRWIQKYISAFGGDPTKVTIWGQSAGAMSVALHMLADNGDPKGLFRAGFMESGSAIPTGYIDSEFLQNNYDGIVRDTGCLGAKDTLGCLRGVSADVLKVAMDKTPTILSYETETNTPWFPRADGVFLVEPAEHQLLKGPVANIPFVNGDVGDEGTVFSLSTLNITTDVEFLDYTGSSFYRNTSRVMLEKILALYPADPAAGSPFGTGGSFAYSPQYKRMAAFQGDCIFQAPRRLFVSQLASKQPVYSYLSEINKIDAIGAAHGTELANIYGGGDLGDYFIRLVSTLDPNEAGAFHWPRYTKEAPQLLTFLDGAVPLNITLDRYRGPQIEYLTKLSLADPM